MRPSPRPSSPARPAWRRRSTAPRAGPGEGEQEESLFDASARHFGEFFTPTGRPRRDAQTLERDAREARAKSEAGRERLDAIESDVGAEMHLRSEVANVEAEIAERERTLARFDTELDAIERLRAELRERTTEHEIASSREREAIQAARQRGQLVAAQAGAAAEVESLAEALESEEPAHIAAGAELRHVDENLAAARAERDTAEASYEAARRDAAFRRGERELGDLRDRAERVSREQAEVTRARELLAGPEIAPDQLQAIQQAQMAVEAAKTRLATEGPLLQLRPSTVLEVSVDGARRRIEPGELLEERVSEAMVIDVPGIGELRVVAGAAVAERRKALEEAKTRLRVLCMEADVDDHAGAVAAVTARKAARDDLARGEARLAEALGSDAPGALARRIDALSVRVERYQQERPGGTPFPPDLEAAERELEGAAAHVQTQRARVEEWGARQTAASRRFHHYEQHRSETQTRLELAEQNRSDLCARLEAARLEIEDEVLEAQRETCCAATRALDEATGSVRRRLAEHEPETTEEKARTERDARDSARARLRELREALVRVGERLQIAGEESRFEEWQDAERCRERAEQALARYQRQARAAARLFEALRDARESTRREYAAPLAAAVTELGRPLYGDDFGVELDDRLEVARRILDGRSLPPRLLSAGAREQLALLTRLAAAKLAGDVPLWLDDALGHTDPERLASLGPLLAAAGEQHQVIVLTCAPERFRSVRGAHVLTLD